MPRRRTPLVTNEIYHIINKGIAGYPTFKYKKDYNRAKLTVKYYLHKDPPMRLSKFLTLDSKARSDVLLKLKKGEKTVEIYSYCLMPNHYHFLLKQIVDNGISTFISRFQNSYTKYFNTRHERYGQLFLDQFKNILVDSQEQLLHTSRYIHLNPYSSHLVNTRDLEDYEWSSLPEYLKKDSQDFCNTGFILDQFGGALNYKKFVFDHKDYQRKLERYKHLFLE